ncbi:MAG: mechanosensitive ion channel family protein [Verrucomicrobia bacterium]|nr:MAG: mechanosensitive ion channel family protein [Verrucomicrobiota bacterium]
MEVESAQVETVMEEVLEPVEAFFQFMQRDFVFGSLSFTPLSILLGVVLLTGLVLLNSILKRVLRRRVFPRAGLTPGVSSAMSTLAGYIILVIGLLIILPISVQGFNMATLGVLLGAVSFGIGFGLRNIADNFVSGLILLIERPIKVGDRIEVEGVFGTVNEIRARSTTVVTNDNISIIVPNSQFIASQVTNVSHSDSLVRYRMPVGVHYNSDVHVVTKALLEAASACEALKKDPKPAVRFLEFGDNSLNFELWVWTDTHFDRPNNLKSQVNYLIWDKLKKYEIEIPYPQRDLYIKEMPESIRIKE